MQYNVIDHITYCTSTERATASAAILAESLLTPSSTNTGKYWDVDTAKGYVVYDGAWYSLTTGTV